MDIAFIVGFPRSGTTYLQSLLSTQEKIISLPETHFFSLVSKGFYDVNQDLDQIDLTEIDRRLKKMMDFNLSSECLATLENMNQNGIGKKNLFSSILSDYFEQKHVSIESKIVLEKTPDHIRHIVEIKGHLPNARFICMIRNPYKSINSFYERLTEYRQPYTQLARQWRESYNTVDHFIKEFSDSIILVKYEDLRESRNKVMDRIGGFLGLQVDLNKLENHRKETARLITSNEPWKQDNFNIPPTTLNMEIPFLERLKIWIILHREMKVHGY